MPLLNLPYMKNWGDHQALAQRLYSLEYPDLVVEEFGRNGQSQGGIDILIRSKDGLQMIGVQCRLVQKMTTKDLRKAYEDSQQCPFTLTEYWMFTNRPRDVAIQREAINLTKTGLILCKVESWDDIQVKVQRHQILLREFYRDMGWAKALIANSVVVFLNMPPESSMELLIASIPDKVNHYGGLLWVCDLQSKHGGITTRIGELPYRLQDVFPMYEAYYIQNWINQFQTSEDILNLSVGNQAIKAKAEFNDEWVEWFRERQAK